MGSAFSRSAAAVDMNGMGSNGTSWRVSTRAWLLAQAQVPDLMRRVPAAEHRRLCHNVLSGSNEPGFSQAWQDWFMYRNLFAGQRSGLYVDIGTNDALAISNTAFFDVCLGWAGVCFEPRSAYHGAILQKRSCRLSQHCVLGQAANVTMSREGTNLGRVTEATNDAASTHSCVRFSDEIARLGFSGRTIDLLSIDIEGSESSVLRCMPWKEVDIRVVLIETNRVTNLAEIDLFFHNHGYLNIASLVLGDGMGLLDNIYVKIPGGPLITPRGKPTCTPNDKKRNMFCGPYGKWAWGAAITQQHPWGPCPLERPPRGRATKHNRARPS